MLQGTVIGFDKMFLLQTFSFLVVLPLLVFLRIKKADKPAHVELAAE